MMVTDDSLQDKQQVIAAKRILYKEHLPDHIKKVHFTSDGAGCFKSKLHRCIQPCWKIWSNVDEVTFRVTPAGDGKSFLDGMFSRVNSVLTTGVNQGGAHYDAATTVEVATSGLGLAATEFVLFEPDRSKH